MADDTRQNRAQLKEHLEGEAFAPRPDQKAFTGAQWQDAKSGQYRPQESANSMAGGTTHTAGGKEPEYSLSNAVGMIQLSDFTAIHTKPCAREALLTGIGMGFGAGGLRAVLGGKVWTSCTYAVVSFVLGSGASHQYCLYRRQKEREGMMRAVEVLNRKELERKAREARKEQVRAERRKVQEAEQDSRFAAARAAAETDGSKKWWKPW